MRLGTLYIPPVPLEPGRTVDELRELRELTGDEDGAQRVAWTDTWVAGQGVALGQARAHRRRRGDRRGREPVVHAARASRSARSLIGGHIDSVPNGGWLDGALNVVAGIEVLRRIAADGTPPSRAARQLGGRGGRALRPLPLRLERGRGDDGRPGRARGRASTPTASRWEDALAAHGVDLDRALDAHAQLEGAAAYLELHIEQGPVLEAMDLPLGVGARHLRRRAPPDHVPRPGRARRLDADGQAPRRARRRRQARPRDPRDRSANRRRRRLHDGELRHEARASSRRSSRRPPCSSTSATSTRAKLAGDARRGQGGERALRRARRTSRSSGSGSGASTRSSSTTR